MEHLGTCETTDWPHLSSDGRGTRRLHARRQSCTNWAEVAPSRSPAQCVCEFGGRDPADTNCPEHGASAAGPGEREALRERLAKALWDAEIAEERRNGNPLKDWAQWPEDAGRQPYCQSTYRIADALVAVVREFNEPFRQRMIDVAKQADEAMAAGAAVPQAPPEPTIDDEFVLRVEDELGHGAGSWDMVDAAKICKAVLKVAGAAAVPAPGRETPSLFCTNCGATLTTKDNITEDMYQCQSCGSVCKLIVADSGATLKEGIDPGAYTLEEFAEKFTVNETTKQITSRAGATAPGEAK